MFSIADFDRPLRIRKLPAELLYFEVFFLWHRKVLIHSKTHCE